MVEMRLAARWERAETEALWSRVFGDGPEQQREFFRLCCPEGPMVLREDGVVRSMLSLPEVTLRFGDGWKLRGGYLYAVATRPEDRGRGYAGQLLHYAHTCLRERGLDFVATVPAQPSLFDYYGRFGYERAFYRRAATAQPGPCRGRKIGAEDYQILRERLLAGAAHVDQGAGMAAVQAGLCPAKGSGLYRLELARGPGIAAVENWPGGPVVKELLCAPEDEAEGGAAAAGLCGRAARVLLPGKAGDMPFGAICWLHRTPPPRWRICPEGYLGLALD